MSRLEKKSEKIFTLEGPATIPHALKLYQQLAEIDPEKEIELDFSGLSDLDTSGAQILLAFTRRFPSGAIHIVHCPEKIRSNLELLALDAEILEN